MVLVAIITLFAMTPSGDGLYVLPIAMTSIATTIAALAVTIRIRRVASS